MVSLCLQCRPRVYAYLIEGVEGGSDGPICALAPQGGGFVLEDHMRCQKVSEIFVTHRGRWTFFFSYARLFVNNSEHNTNNQQAKRIFTRALTRRRRNASH